MSTSPVPSTSRFESAEGASPLADVQVEQHEARYLVSRPRVGALSVLSEIDLPPFHFFLLNPTDSARVARLYEWAGLEAPAARDRAARLAARLKRDGWLREHPPSPNATQRLQQVYFTVTRECDLACLYCYQGLRKRRGKEMPLEHAREALKRIATFNPDCHVAVTGGEPFMHPQATLILDAIEALGLRFGVLCNGSFVDERLADRLAGYRRLVRFQISLDGMTESTHALTRGRANFAKAMRAIELLVERDLPLVLAPTVHEGNAHELPDLAVFAASIGAWFSPNNLRSFPHDENNGRFQLENDTLRRMIAECTERLRDSFDPAFLAAIERRVKGPDVCSVAAPNAKFTCGTGHSLLDIDWNGEVYPCHLLKDRGLILGNVFEQPFEEIFERAGELGVRVPSYEIPKCSGCKFSSRCGGGCRAGAFYAYGSLAREDDLCAVNYQGELERALQEV